MSVTNPFDYGNDSQALSHNPRARAAFMVWRQENAADVVDDEAVGLLAQAWLAGWVARGSYVGDLQRQYEESLGEMHRLNQMRTFPAVGTMGR